MTSRVKDIEAEKARLRDLGARIERIQKPKKLGPPKPRTEPPAMAIVYGVEVEERDEPIVRCIADALLVDIDAAFQVPRLQVEAAKTARSALEVFRSDRGYKGDSL